MARTIAWFSSGAASAVMSWRAVNEDRGVQIVQCDLGASEDEDNRRFTAECEQWFGVAITHIKSEKFSNIDEVFEKRRYHAGINGAPCTGELKVAPRLDFQRPSDVHLFGYTADNRDMKRFERMQKEYPELKCRAPLIERGITKEMCLAILTRAGIKPPRVYAMGFPNANCIGCVKATSPAYWALVRKEFPEVFARRADQSRRFGSRLIRLPGQGDTRFFLDELPEDFPIKDVKAPRCDFMCQSVEEELF
jgi:hypothetical protein